MSRARWSYRVNGTGSRVRDRELLAALAELFDIPVDYLYSGQLSADMQADLPAILSMRADRVLQFATRELGALAPDSVAKISAALQLLIGADAQSR